MGSHVGKNKKTFLLHHAANAAEALRLIENGASVNDPDDRYITPIWMAILDGRADVVNVLLKHGAFAVPDIYKTISARTTTMLETATALGHRDVVDVFTRNFALQVAAGVYVDGETALHYVTDTEYAEQLIQEGCDVNAFSWSYGTPLHSASRNNRTKVVQTLLRYGADVNRKESKFGNTPLHMSTDEHIIECLLNHGADINAQNAPGITKLHQHENHQHFNEEDASRVRMLLRRGADVNAAHFDGNLGSPLFVAELLQYFSVENDIVELIADCEVRLDETNGSGETSLHLAAKDDNTEIVGFLTRNAPNLVDIVDIDGNLPIHFVRSESFLEELLFEAAGRASLNVANNMGATPLHTAMSIYAIGIRIRVSISENLLNAMLKCCPLLVNQRDKFGDTPLHCLVSCNDIKNIQVAECVRALMSHGCDINAQNVFGQTPLHLCAVSDDDAYANLTSAVNMADKLGRTPMHYHASNQTSTPSRHLQNLVTVGNVCKQDCWLRTPLHYSMYLLFLTGTKILPKFKTVVDMKDRFDRTALHYAAITHNEYYYNKLIALGADTTAKDIDGATPSQLLLIDRYDAVEIRFIKLIYHTDLNAGRRKKCKYAGNAFKNQCNYMDQSWNTFEELRKAGTISVCKENCVHSLLQSEGLLENEQSEPTSCLYRLRPERDVVKYVWRIWKELVEKDRHPLTPIVNENVYRFMEQLTSAVGAKDKRFVGRLVHVGSSYEGTKVGHPEEYDFNIELIRFSEICSPVPSFEPGFYNLQLLLDSDDTNKKEHFKEFLTVDNFLRTDLIKLEFEILLKSVLYDSEFWKNEWYFEYSVETQRTCNDFAKPFSQGNVCTNIKINTFRRLGREPKDYFTSEISIDIVPCLHINGWWPPDANLHSLSYFDKAVAEELYEYGCTFVFTQPNKVYRTAKHSSTSARVSFSFADSRLIRSSPAVVRAAYMVGKALDNIERSFTDDMYCESYAPTSYMLKTAVLFALAEKSNGPLEVTSSKENFEDVDAVSLARWVREIIECRLTFCIQDFVPTFFMPTVRLPVWKFEKYQNFSHKELRRHGVDLRQLLSKPHPLYEQREVYRSTWQQNVEFSFIMSYLQYWSVLEEGTNFSVTFPSI